MSKETIEGETQKGVGAAKQGVGKAVGQTKDAIHKATR